MATSAFNKFNDFVEKQLDGTHDWNSHVFKWYLTNTAPVASNAVKADIAEISAGNGYTAGGLTTTITLTEASGVAKVAASDVTLTATGAVGPFRYGVLYNDTSASDNLVGWVDYGSSITMANTETFTIDCDDAAGLFTLT